MNDKSYTRILERIELKIQDTNTHIDIMNIKQLNDYLMVEYQQLREDVKKNGFSDEMQEIYFFKHVKPQILSRLFYYSKIFRIETQTPPSSSPDVHKYFEQIQKELDINFAKTIRGCDFYIYWKTKATHKDDDYFLRKNCKLNSCARSFSFEVDPDFSTYYDNRIAHYLCDGMLRDYLIERTCRLRCKKNGNNNSIPWTGQKSNLVELIYALHESKSIDNGALSIQKTIQLFETFFEIDLGDIYHTFHRMKQRANSRTLFIDKLKLHLEHLMDKQKD